MGNCCNGSSGKFKIVPTANSSDDEKNSESASRSNVGNLVSPRSAAAMPTQLRSIDPKSGDRDKIDHAGTKSKESHYWSDLEASFNFGSLKTVQVSKLVNKQFSGGMHRVPSRRGEKKDKK